MPTDRLRFRLICTHCGSIGIRIPDPDGPDSSSVFCSSCDRLRGNLGDLRDTSALADDSDDQFTTEPSAMLAEDVFEIGSDGRKTLVGLTFEETQEFFELNKLLDCSIASASVERWTHQQERRFVELLLRYEASVQDHLDAATRH